MYLYMKDTSPFGQRKLFYIQNKYPVSFPPAPLCTGDGIQWVEANWHALKCVKHLQLISILELSTTGKIRTKNFWVYLHDKFLFICPWKNRFQTEGIKERERVNIVELWVSLFKEESGGSLKAPSLEDSMSFHFPTLTPELAALQGHFVDVDYLL